MASENLTQKTAVTSLTTGDLLYALRTTDPAGTEDKNILWENLLSQLREEIGVPAGSIEAYGGSTVPDGWILCDGSAVSRTTYDRLFSSIGTTWGVGDASTTFNVPDLEGSFLRGSGSHGTETMADGNPYAGPAVGSFEDDQMQGHIHQMPRTFSRYTPGGNADGGLGTGNYSVSNSSNGPQDDGTRGTPRTGDETRPFAAGVKYIIKT